MKYSDRNDKITKLYISLSTTNQYLWEILEHKAYKHVETYFLNYKEGKILDAGCGEGRLEPVLVNYFDSVVLIDEDFDRLKIAKNSLLKFKNRLMFVQSKIEEMPFRNNYFDVVICSHVLQHMFEDSYPVAIKIIYDRIKKFGTLVFTTSITAEVEDSTFLVIENNGKIIKKFVSLKEKEDIQKIKSALFVRHFSIKNIKKLLSLWKIEKFIIYHQFYRDKLVNSEPIIYNHLPMKFPLCCDSADVMFVLKPLN